MNKISAYAQLIKTPLANGKYPIGIFTNINGESKPKRSGYACKLSEWNADKTEFNSTYPNYKLANEHLRRQIAQAKAPHQKNDVAGLPVAHIDTRKQPKVEKPNLDYVTYMNSIDGDHAQSKGLATRIRLYCGAVDMDKMNMRWLREFRDWCRHTRIHYDNRTNTHRAEKCDEVVLKNGTQRTIEKWLRKFMKRAIAEELINFDPWGTNKHKLVKYIETDPYWMNTAERGRFVALMDQKEKMTDNQYTTLLYCLLGCFSGLRQDDWHRFLNEERVVDDGNSFFLRAGKNKEMVVIPIGPTLRRILGLIYERKKQPHAYNTMLLHIKVLFDLAKIYPDREYGTHTMRHSFGRLLAETPGITLQTAADLLGDTPEVAQKYFHRTGKLVSEEAKALQGV